MLSSLPYPPLVCHCIYPSFLLPSFFCFWQEKTGDMKHFPIFFSSLTRLVKTSRKEEVCHFSPTANQQNITASLHWRDHLFLKGSNSGSTFFKTSEIKCCEGTSRVYTVLHTQAATSRSHHLIFLLLCTESPLFSFSLLEFIRWAVMGVRENFCCNLAYFHKEILMTSSCCFFYPLKTSCSHFLVIGLSQTQKAELDIYLVMSVVVGRLMDSQEWQSCPLSS